MVFQLICQAVLSLIYVAYLTINIDFLVEVAKIIFVSASLTGGLLTFAWQNERNIKKLRPQH